ncbi:MAG: hypothetical protein K2K64_11265, partial [Muribaculaceae bacterium]|nr:hypothetical protein [Muribaculaceae bacterium]
EEGVRQATSSKALNSKASNSKMPRQAVAATPAEKKEKRISKASSPRREYAAKRRRRSDASRELSMQRDVETASIPLHKESERSGMRVSVSGEEKSGDVVSAAISEKERKRMEKLAKKERKEREKQKKMEEKRKRKADAHNAKRGKIVTVYKIQILASADLLKQNNPRFCGLAPISTFKENNLYKYYYGESLERAEMESLLKEVRKKIPDAFVVASTKSSH